MASHARDPLSWYNELTILSSCILDHKSCGETNNGQLALSN